MAETNGDREWTRINANRNLTPSRKKQKFSQEGHKGHKDGVFTEGFDELSRTITKATKGLAPKPYSVAVRVWSAQIRFLLFLISAWRSPAIRLVSQPTLRTEDLQSERTKVTYERLVDDA